jgi:hypothetical protein
MADILATEGGSVFVTAEFTDRNESDVVPNSITWSLTDEDGDIINSREDIAIVTPAASVTIEISGDDLPWEGNYPSELYYLYVLFKAVYDEADATDVPQNQEKRIAVSNLRGVS